MPGPISTDTEELIRDILSYDGDSYTEKYDKFCEKYNAWDDGKASAKVVHLIEGLMNG